LDSKVRLFAVKRVPVCHFNVSGRAVIGIVGNTIADCETLKVGLENSFIISVSGIVGVNSIRQVRHVHSGVGFSGDVKLVFLKFGELFEKGKNCGKIVFGDDIVVPVIALCCAMTVGETNASG
jgi:hypothetical protein